MSRQPPSSLADGRSPTPLALPNPLKEGVSRSTVRAVPIGVVVDTMSGGRTEMSQVFLRPLADLPAQRGRVVR
jgi:hypothetical protein